MTAIGSRREGLPEAVRRALDAFANGFALDLHLWGADGSGREHLYPEEAEPSPPGDGPTIVRELTARDGGKLELEIRSSGEQDESKADVLQAMLEQALDFDHEIRFFTYEVSERYEEINLLYSISETLGSILRLDEAARVILDEVCDVMGAKRGSLWVFRAEDGLLHQVAAVGIEGLQGPLDPGEDALTAHVFREGEALISTGDRRGPTPAAINLRNESALFVPIRYTPHLGEARTVGVINLFGQRRGGPFSASDQKLLSAIASQVGAALENNRLIQESLAQEGMSREMELAHNLQMKLLQPVDQLGIAQVAARVQPAEQVGGDFYHFIKLSGGRLGIMIGDVSSHGFPAALIMALSLSAASIYAGEAESPAEVLRHIDDALRDELESTEMYLTLFCGVLDPEAGELVYSNAGHPHAFVFRSDRSEHRLSATDPPVGIAGPGSYGEDRVTWTRGKDLLLLFTDGLSDTLATAARTSGEQVVIAETKRLIECSPEAIVDALFSLASHATPSIPSDDQTAIVLRT